MIVFGYQEWGVIFVLFFLMGLGFGRRWVDRPRAERVIPCLKVSAVIAVLYGLVWAIGSIVEGAGLRWTFPGLVYTTLTFLIFGLPFTAGALLWPRRREPGVSL